MVEVEAVFELQLPVAFECVGDGAGQRLQPLRTLVGHQVDEHLRFAQVRLDAGHVRRKARKEEPAIVREARHRHEVVILRGERLGVPAVLAIGNARVAPATGVGPAVIAAHVAGGIAACVGNDDRPTMATAVQQANQGALRIPRNQHRLAADGRGEVVVGFGHLRLQPDELPGGFEHVPHLEFEEVRVEEGAAVNVEHALRRAVIDQPGKVDWIHRQ